jgi:hypothetical protein
MVAKDDQATLSRNGDGMMRLTFTFLIGLLVAVCSPVLVANTTINTSNTTQQWRFTVFLDDDEIGFHNFIVENREDQQLIYSNARFDVKFLFFTAYTYEHSNVEQWQGHCLKKINAVTNDNGENYSVAGESSSDGFIVETEDAKTIYSSCIKTFAYWDPSFLQTSKLLNSQTGELVDVEVDDMGEDKLSINGNDIAARKYRLLGEKLQIDLWYSDEDRWLALESLTEDGHRIRYQMQ